MKKIFKTILILFLLSSINVKADSYYPNVTFTLIASFTTDITKTYSNGITVFDLTNNLDNMNLSDNELKQILSQKPGDGSSRLTYYETLNIKVTPQLGTNFSPLVSKSTYYRGSNAGKWVSSLDNVSIDKDPVAAIKTMDSDFWPYGFAIEYRTNPNDNFTRTIPTGVNLSDSTLEEQLATLLNINLIANPNGVIDEYQNLYRFKLLDNYTYVTRFDFYSEKEGVTPVLNGGNYDITSLNLLDSYYVAIKYHKTTPTIKAESLNKSNKTNFVLIIGGSIIIGLGLFIYLKKTRKI